MKVAGKYLLCLMVVLGWNVPASAQCYNCNSHYPSGVHTTTSNTPVTVSTCSWGAEYSFYHVEVGETYNWNTCNGGLWDSQLTLFSGSSCIAPNLITYNDDDCGLQSSLTWTATFTGQVTLLLTQWNCNSNFSCMGIDWSCTSCGSGGNGITCPGTFYDSGGPSGNYSNHEYTVTTICPPTPESCVSVHFNSFSIENYWDYLDVYDGSSTSSPELGFYTGTQLAGETLIANNATGCLTFVFDSDGSLTYPGWSATVSCVDCGSQPPASQQDCNGAHTICSDNSFAGNSSGAGIQELNSTNRGCLSTENQSSWFFFSPQSTGTMAFMLTPTPLRDYDFAVWGPYDSPICPPPGPPLRCSWAAPSVPTGLQAGAGDNSEGAGGDGVVNPITVGPGDVGKVYILMIDNWSASSTPYNFTWNNSGGLTLDCTPLPVEILSFDGTRDGARNKLIWSVASEINADHYLIERSTDGFEYQTIGYVYATGGSEMAQEYILYDEKPALQSYYILKQVDNNGAENLYGPVAIGRQITEIIVTHPFPNPATDGKTALDITMPFDAEISMQLIDLTGRQLYLESSPLTRGFNTLQIDLSHLASGVYEIRLLDHQSQLLHSSRLMK